MPKATINLERPTDTHYVKAWGGDVTLTHPDAHWVYQWIKRYDETESGFIHQIDAGVDLIAKCVTDDGANTLDSDEGREALHRLQMKHQKQFFSLLDACLLLVGVAKRQETPSKKKRGTTQNGRTNTLKV